MFETLSFFWGGGKPKRSLILDLGKLGKLMPKRKEVGEWCGILERFSV